MEAKDLLRFQLNGSCTVIRDRLVEISDLEWAQRAVPGTSKPGFLLWHCARTVDAVVHRLIQGRPEIADEREWRVRVAVPDGLFGAGIPDAVADSVPAQVERTALLDYVEAVRPRALEWLERQSPDDLDRQPDLRANLAEVPEYLAEPVWAEIGDFVGAPTWQYLARAGISHIRVHMGEVDGLLAALRAGAARS